MSRMRQNSIPTVVYSNFVCNRQSKHDNMKSTYTELQKDSSRKTKFSLNKVRSEETKLPMCCQTETTSVGFFFKGF